MSYAAITDSENINITGRHLSAPVSSISVYVGNTICRICAFSKEGKGLSCSINHQSDVSPVSSIATVCIHNVCSNSVKISRFAKVLKVYPDYIWEFSNAVVVVKGYGFTTCSSCLLIIQEPASQFERVIKLSSNFISE